MLDGYFPQGGAALAEALAIDEPKNNAQTPQQQEIEEEEFQEAPEQEEEELDVPKKFIGKDGKINLKALAKSYSQLEKEYDRTINTSKEKDQAIAELQSWANNAYGYIQKMTPQQAAGMTEQFVNQNQLSQAQQGKLLEALERDPESTLVQMLQSLVQQQLSPVLGPLQQQTLDHQIDRAVYEMADNPDKFPDFWEVKDAMADVIEEFAKDYPNAENDPRLLKYAYDVARGRTADNLRQTAKEQGRQEALAATQKKRKAFAEGNYGKSGRGTGKSEGDEMMEAMMKSAGPSWWGNSR